MNIPANQAEQCLNELAQHAKPWNTPECLEIIKRHMAAAIDADRADENAVQQAAASSLRRDSMGSPCEGECPACIGCPTTAPSSLLEENQWLREQVYAYPPSDFSPDGQTWKQVAELQASRLAESANIERVLDWIRAGTKSAVLSFTEGPERQVAYAVEDDRRRRLGDAVTYPWAQDAKTVASHEFGLSPGLTVSVRVTRKRESAVLRRTDPDEADPDAASQERMGNLVGAVREHLSRRDLRWLLERVIAEVEDRYAGLHRTPDLRAALTQLEKLVRSD